MQLGRVARRGMQVRRAERDKRQRAIPAGWQFDKAHALAGWHAQIIALAEDCPTVTGPARVPSCLVRRHAQRQRRRPICGGHGA